jgi:hypothetical protein
LEEKSKRREGPRLPACKLEQVVDSQTARDKVGSEERTVEFEGKRELSEKRKRGYNGCEKRGTGLIWEDDVLKAWAKTLGHERGTDPEGSAGNWHGVGKVAEGCELSEEWSKDGPEGRGQDDFDGVSTEGESKSHEKLLCASETESDDSGRLSNMSRSPPLQDTERCTKASWKSRHPDVKWRCPNPQAFGYMYCTKHVAMGRKHACQRGAPFVSRSSKRKGSKQDEERGAGPKVPRKKRIRLGLRGDQWGQEEDEGFWSAPIFTELGKGTQTGRQSKKAKVAEMLKSGFGGEGRQQESYPLRSRKKILPNKPAGKLRYSAGGTAQHPIEFPSDDESPASSSLAKRVTPQPAENPVSKTPEASCSLHTTRKSILEEEVGEPPELAGAAARSIPGRIRGRSVPSSERFWGGSPGTELPQEEDLASFGETRSGGGG